MSSAVGVSPALRDPRAACAKESNPDVMFVEIRGDWEPARRVCASCPLDLKVACLKWAVSPASWQDHGMWGGTTPRERRKLVKERDKRRAARQRELVAA